jgi:hypothetical protein
MVAIVLLYIKSLRIALHCSIGDLHDHISARLSCRRGWLHCHMLGTVAHCFRRTFHELVVQNAALRRVVEILYDGQNIDAYV